MKNILFTFTSKCPVNKRDPTTKRMVPTENRVAARHMALNGTLGGGLMNCKMKNKITHFYHNLSYIWWNWNLELEFYGERKSKEVNQHYKICLGGFGWSSRTVNNSTQSHTTPIPAGLTTLTTQCFDSWRKIKVEFPNTPQSWNILYAHL